MSKKVSGVKNWLLRSIITTPIACIYFKLSEPIKQVLSDLLSPIYVSTYIWFKSNFYTTNGCLPPGSGFLFLKAIERPKTGLKSGQASKTLGSHSDGF